MAYPITRQFGPNAKGSELTFADMDNNLLYLDAKVTGSNGYIALFNGTSAVSSSIIYQSTGSIGINTTSPSVDLDVKGTTLGGKIRIQNNITTDFAQLLFSGSSTNLASIFLNGSTQTAFAGANSFNVYQGSNAPLAFWTNATERIRIDNSGNVGIGKTSPNTLLDVNGNTIITGSLTITSNTVIGGSLSVTSNATVSSITGSLLVPNLGGISLAGGVFTSPSTLSKTQLNLIDDTGATLNISASSNSILTSQGGDIVIRTGTLLSTPTERLRITTAGDTSITGSLTATSLTGSLNVPNGGNIISYGPSTSFSHTIGSNGLSIQSGSINLYTSLLLANNTSSLYSAGAPFIISTGATFIGMVERFRVTTTGNVGINTSAPTDTLDVNGTIRARTLNSGVYSANLNVTSNGVLTTNTSDERFKKNIETINNPLQKVLQLRGVTFNWKDETNPKKMMGFIAQEVLPIVPEVVFENPTDGYYGLNYAEMVALLSEAVKEQQDQIEELKKQITSIVSSSRFYL